MFHITYSISQKRRYLYCEAICLLADSKIDDRIEMLESLYVYPFKDEELDAKIALLLGREFALKGNTKRASEIAYNVLNSNYHEFDIKIDEMADYLYILKDYKACVELYDKCEFLEETDWLEKYFYALKQLGKLEEASKKLHCITEDIKQKILETQENPSEFESDEDLKMYLL